MWHTRDVDTKLDLKATSRETLLAVIDELQRRIASLEARLNRRGSAGMPGNKPLSGQQTPDQQSSEKKEPRKLRRHGFARKRMTPTRRVEHALEVCPDCGTHLNGGWVQRTREVIELPVAPVEVTDAVLGMSWWPASVRYVSGAGCPRRFSREWFWAISAWGSIW